MRDAVKFLTVAPESQLDPAVVEQIKQLLELSDQELAVGLMEVLDDCVAGSLCSDFVVVAMDTIITAMVGNEDWRNRER